jgi:hypothetical protein
MVVSFGFGCDFARLTEARPQALQIRPVGNPVVTKINELI